MRLEVDSLSIRRAAVLSIMSLPRGAKYRKRIVTSLPADQAFLLDLKPALFDEVPHVRRPQKHLSDTGRQSDTTKPPRLADDETVPPASDTKRSRRAPEV